MYEPAAIEEKWRGYWKEKKLFKFNEKDDKKELFVIDTPPPFTNAVLHMGQVFWVCYIDSIARYKRMKGFNVLYPQGWDTHGFPTEIAVEKKYGKGLSRSDFFSKAVEVAKANTELMKAQMLILGASFDEKYEYSTLTKEYIAKVQLALLIMNDKKMVYRGEHPVPWCVSCGTSVSREQSEEVERVSSLNYIDFMVGKKEKINIATSRPELLHACVALAVNPTDEKYKKLIGKKASVPLHDRTVEIIGDESVDVKFGTGAEMVCTFGDKEDVKMYYRYKLKLIQAMDERGKLKNAGKFDGMSLAEARLAIVKELQASGALTKQEELKQMVKIHDRCKTPLELLSYTQWFIKVQENAEKLKEIGNEMKWVPEYTRHRFLDWANNIEWDWNISRKRIFGTPIPFWYCKKCGEIVAPSKDKLPVDPVTDKPPIDKCPKCGGALQGDTDTCDGWVDTCITPLVVAGWPDNKKLMERAFPTSLRIQGTDIIRTWAFYTAFGTWAVTDEKPFERIIAHGMILGTDGREMHKSLGNGILPEELMAKYSSDTIRMWVALCGGIGKDKPFSYQELDHAKSFVTKLYNSANFVKVALEKGKIPKQEPHADLNIFDIWILSRLNQVTKEVTEAYDNLMLYEAMDKAVNFYWHEFADYYIENVKHRVYSEDKKMEKSKQAALFTLKHVMDMSLRMFAPVIPFISEEINSWFNKGSILEQSFPAFKERPTKSDYVINGFIFKSGIVDVDAENAGAFINQVISEVRKQKAKNRIALNKEITSININVPDEYYNATLTAKEEIKQICKASNVQVAKSKDFLVDIKV